MKKLLIILSLCSLFAGCAVNKQTKSLHAFKGDAIGCGDFIVYKLSGDNKEYISIAFNAKKAELQDFQAYGVGKTDIMEVKYRKYKAPISASICNDVMTDKPELLVEESPTQGVIEIIISEEEREKAKNNQGYSLTIVLKKVLFEHSTIDYLRIENVFVGWLPG